MSDLGTYSDEPTRIRQMVEEFLTQQSSSRVSPAGFPDVNLAIGADMRDDCAVYEIGGPVSLVVGTDYVRGAKFILYELGYLSNFDVGYYLVAANVSDVAAMGATPIGVLTVVRYPPEMTDEDFRSVIAGIHQACTDFGTLNVGGDIGNGERLIVSGSALGICQSGKVLTRGGAKPGDVLCVTGPCGILGAAVAYFPKRAMNGWSLPADIELALLESWRRPVARVAEGRLLSSGSLATACQDTSDGLKATIEQIGSASGVGFDVHEEAVVVDDAVVAVATLLDVEPLALSMSASADFQLAFTVDPRDLGRCQAEFEAVGLSLTVIGEATGSGAVRAVRADGSARALPGVAWKHQQTEISSLVVDGPDLPHS